MDLKYGIPITRIKVTDIPVKNLFIKAVGNISADNKITALKFENKPGVVLNPNYWLAGVDYEDKNVNESKATNDDEPNSLKYDTEQDEKVYAEGHCKRSRRICRHT